MKKSERIKRILDYFYAQQPEITTELEFGTVYQLLCAVVLSAQCTDKRVNMVTPGLFRHFPDARAMAQQDIDEEEAMLSVLEHVSSVSYPNAKARHLVQLSRMLVEKYNAEVPSDFDALVSLPGVGRKTANVMLAVAFGEAAMPVDTHVFRVAHRLAFVPKSADTPEKVERHLVRLIPNEWLSLAHHWLLLHGRYVCTARKPHCERCPISELCPRVI